MPVLRHSHSAQAYPPTADPLFGYFSAVRHANNAIVMAVSCTQVAGPSGRVNAEKLQKALTAAGVADYPKPGGEFNEETVRDCDVRTH